MNKRCMGCMETYREELGICPYCGYVDGTPVEEQIHMEPGTVLHDRYVIGKVLGFGGFGVTYIGWDNKLEMKVAVKEYLPSEFSTRMPGQTMVTVFRGEKQEQFREGLKKFVDEAKRLANFKNEEGVVRVYDSFTENETAYIVMEYLEGETLAELLEREGAIPEDRAVEMMMPVMKSLEVIHSAGILHRDIAPDNIFITKDGTTKLIDFGASRYATTSHSRSLTVIIKPGYSPEEQYRSNGDQGTHTDVYALGATLYKMMTGKTPPDAMERRAQFEGQNKDILIEPRKLNKSISQVREVAILNAMNVRVQDRTSNVQIFIRELESEYPAKRRYGKIKKIDVFAWPLWLKIAIPAALSLVLIFGILLATGVISFASLFSDKVNVPDGYVVTPNVEGLSLDEAFEKLQAEKLSPKLEDSVISDYIEADMIVSQSPASGQYSKENSEVALVVSKGTGEVIEPINGISVVPYLVGSTEQEALDNCRKAGLNAKTSKEYSNDFAEGHIISQDSEAGKKVPEHSTVQLVVSKGIKPEPTTEKQVVTAPAQQSNAGNADSISNNSFDNNNNNNSNQYESTVEKQRIPDTAVELAGYSYDGIIDLMGGVYQHDRLQLSNAFSSDGCPYIYNYQVLPGFAFATMNGDYFGISIMDGAKLNDYISSDMSYNQIADIIGDMEGRIVAQENNIACGAEIDGYHVTFCFIQNSYIRSHRTSPVITSDLMREGNPSLQSIGLRK